MKRWLHYSATIPLILFVFSTSFPLHAQVRQLGLTEIVHSAKSTFVGTVTQVRYGYDEHHDIVTYTTFRVEEQVTGSTPNGYTIKQLGGVMNGLDTRLAHIRYFTKRERVMIAAYPKSSLGFSNPVGLDQGVWRVTRTNQVLDVTPRQLQGVEAATLVKHGISAAAANSSAAQPVLKKRFESLLRALSLAPAYSKGGYAQ